MAPGYRALFVTRILLRSYFFIPFLVLYARDIGISLSLLLVVEAVFALLIVAFDLPAGYLADRIGPRQALMLGAVFEGVAALMLGLAPAAVVFWAVQPLFAASTALTQGADAGLASGLLRTAGQDTARFEAGEHRVQSVSLAWIAAVFVAASGLSLISLQATFLATAVAQFAACALLLAVPDVRQEPVHEGVVSFRRWTRRLARGIGSSPALRADLLAMIFTGTAFSILLYLMPLYVVDAGLDENLTGVASAGIALAAAGAAGLWRPRWGIRLMVALAVAASLAMALPLVAAVLMAGVVINAAQARLLPRYRARVMADLGDHGEAAAMSVVTSAGSLGFACLAPLLGIITGLVDASGLAVICAMLFAGAGLLMSATLHRAPAEEVA